ncbi:GNAT family N-acetyltransferase [Angustibacter sp. McL0619]|uniref:GNAT family N-acetyltransferase n=1 Tax=Angustibacter sp. McL0619 TaxID=3415676 RepID=UPI003CF98912
MELSRTPDLLLRSWRPDDLDGFFDVYSRWDVMRWLGPQPRRAVVDLDEAAERLARWVQRGLDLSAPQGLWAIVPLSAGAVDGVPVGTAMLMPLDDETGRTDEVEVGWHLHPDHQGKGLATRAARALLDRAATAGYPRVLALTDLDNEPSQAVARRLGMADEGPTDRWFGLTMRQFAGSSTSVQR